jgi:hypothetical protein
MQMPWWAKLTGIVAVVLLATAAIFIKIGPDQPNAVFTALATAVTMLFGTVF